MISTSFDGIQYTKIKEEKYPQLLSPEEIHVKNIVVSVPNIEAKYIRIDIISQKKNPEWHSDPGADSWLFVDEIFLN